MIYREGLVLGKFLPLHNGHVGLIRFAAEQCQVLKVLVCASDQEAISGATRLNWLKQTFQQDKNIEPVLIPYLESELPNTSSSSRAISKQWTNFLQPLFPNTDVFISSEPYGEFVAEYWGIDHVLFDQKREQISISGTLIRKQPLKYWSFLPEAVRPFYVCKICLLGTESTGKSHLSQRLAAHYGTLAVPEMARSMMEHTKECTYSLLQKIAVVQAQAIRDALPTANRLLFMDTNLLITESYARFLFDQDLFVSASLEEVHHANIYFYLDKDITLVQDGTRLEQAARVALDASHRNHLTSKNIPYIEISGNWEERFSHMCGIVDQIIEKGGYEIQ